jgi:TPR repeat protein
LTGETAIVECEPTLVDDEKPDLDAARRLWETAAALGEGTAMFNLGVLAEKGLGAPADSAAAKRWYARGAERKNAASSAALQRMGG